MEFNEIAQGGLKINGLATIIKQKLRGLYVSGLNDYGQVGDGTIESRYKPQLINSSLVKFAAGLRHCLAINQNKELYAWGQNLNGRLGDNTEVDRHEPTKIGSATNWEEVACGWNFSLAINSLGELYSWGNNIAGNLGYEPRTDVLIPTKISSTTNWKKISAGRHVLAINSLGELYSWGEDEFGQLGDGLSTSRSTVTKIGTATNWVEIAAGYDHTLAINSSGELWACGRNDYGQLGDGSQTNRSTLVQVGSATNWIKISAGRDHSLAVNSDGELYSWGRNQSGYYQLGLSDETESLRNSPTKIGALTNWIDVAAGFQHSIVLNSNKQIYGFGYNGYGCLGDGTSVSRSSPVVINFIENDLQIKAGGYVTINFVYSNFQETASGGIKASGSSWSSSGVPISGGALLNGQAGNNAILLGSESTMSLIGGSADVSLITSKTIESNGVLLSGNSKISKTFEILNGEGGVSLNGIAIQGFSVTMRGGTRSNGNAVYFIITDVNAAKASVIASGQARISAKYEFRGDGGVVDLGRGVIGIQPKVSGGISVGGSSVNFKIIRPVISGGIVTSGLSPIKCTYNIEKYKRGQGRVGGKARKEKLRKLTTSVIHNVGLSMEAPNILNVPPADPNALIVPKGNETPTLDPNSYRVQHYPGWCEFEDPCASAYVPAIVKKRQGKYMPEKKSDAVVKPGVQLTTSTQQ
jgi:alpha-tubulin suppressor-like RCC1 family protein